MGFCVIYCRQDTFLLTMSRPSPFQHRKFPHDPWGFLLYIMCVSLWGYIMFSAMVLIATRPQNALTQIFGIFILTVLSLVLISIIITIWICNKSSSIEQENQNFVYADTIQQQDFFYKILRLLLNTLVKVFKTLAGILR